MHKLGMNEVPKREYSVRRSQFYNLLLLYEEKIKSLFKSCIDSVNDKNYVHSGTKVLWPN